MVVDTLIIGQGLCGTWLSFWLRQADHSFLVIDDARPATPSQVASGVINPVTGRILAKTWMADELLPFSLSAYAAIGKEVALQPIRSTEILHCFPNQQMQETFAKKQAELTEWLSANDGDTHWSSFFQFYHGLGSIRPALLIDLQSLLFGWRQLLEKENRLLTGTFDTELLSVTSEGIQYDTITARQIIFCNGLSAMFLPWFLQLPFSPNKGEALLLEVDDLPADRIYKKGLSLVPYPRVNGQTNDRIFWAGSTYDNRFTDTLPSAGFRERTEAQLRDWLKPSFRVLDHLAAVRPATIDRRPFAGMHPHFPRIGILNGMGTKGCSLAPWFGQQLAGHLVSGKALQPEADIARFSRLLQP